MKKTSKIYILPTVMLGVTAVAGMAASVPGVNAEDISPLDDEITITVDSSCTMGIMSSSSMTGIIPGETKNISAYNMAAYCNDNNGYDIYAIGYTNGEYGNTDMISADGNIIPTGISGQDSYWNMQLTPGTATGPVAHIPTIMFPFTNKTVIPSDYTKVVTYPSTTISQGEDPMESGSYFKADYYTHASTTQPAGLYTGQVQYVMVHPVGAEAPEKPLTINDLTYMQEFATLSEEDKASVLRSMPYGEQYTLKDNRDQKSYYISKMRDDNVWMTQNLDLCIGCGGVATLTSQNTDLNKSGSGAYVNGYTNDGGLITWSPASTATTSSRTISGTTVTGWSSSNNNPYSVEGGDIYVYASSPTSDTTYNSLESCTNHYSADECAHYHIGNYYNWSAAVASNNSADISTNYAIAENSICPSGWRLPVGRIANDTDTSREFGSLFIASGVAYSYTNINYSDNGFYKIRTAPLYFVRGGNINGSSLDSLAGRGHYLSSSISNASSTYIAVFDSSSVNSAFSWYRYDGYSLRCLVR